MHTSRRLSARLTATASATCLAAAGLALAPAADASAAGAPQGGHVYSLTAANSSKNAAALGDSLANGAAVVQKTVSGGPGQLWEAVDHGDGTFSLVNINSGKCMDIQNGSMNAGAAIIQGTCTGANSQRWTFSGSAIVSPRSGLCLDVSDNSTTEDHRIIQWTCKTTANANQQWSLTERLRSATWGPAMVSGGQTFTSQTIRMVVHNNTSGAGLRIRLSNLRSTTALSVGAVTVAVQSSGATAVAGTTHTVTFGRSATPTIPAGQELTSDVIPMPVVAEQNLLVSVYLPGTTGASTYHNDAHQTSYLSAASTGNHAAEEAATNFTTTTARWFYVAGLDVVSPTAKGTVVAIGDSITDGSSATDNANRRWPDYLARRLQAESGGQRLGVVDAGISGNRVVTDSPSAPQGIAAKTRFSHDVLTQPGVKNVILLEGINDINNTTTPTPADQIIAGYQTMINQAHTAGVRIIGGTILPNSTQTAAKAAIRAQVNQWIRTSGAFDAVIDFDAALRDPANPAQLLPAYDSGDHLHPNSAGMQALANTVNLSLLTS
ncbi:MULTISPECIES: ricin-type beta-trefoil lectin domain protein [unclassified Streptomyces]|uniref:ricin-type beta-trefoil lectin domain protein n=1 Tax=unclassified Streptomyces TaxID=2593676 RepID=UPI0022562BCB|nr:MULTISPECIES: ricin-type beta-trefoil lectin domain protein [unclassified Streptomyces]MCX5051708.1 ricin-type beta-trefoil lectin domain protein [Streptomyces sp. NBC_00474]